MSITGEETHSKLVGYCLWGLGFTGAHRFYFGKTFSGSLLFILSVITVLALSNWLFMIFLWPFCVLHALWWAFDLILIPKIASEANMKYSKGSYNYSIAWLLHTYSGIFGAHRFYLGKWWSGLFYLCTLGVFGIGCFYDFMTLNERVSAKNQTSPSPWWSKFTSQ